MKTIVLSKKYSTHLDDEDYKKFSVFKWHAVQVRPGGCVYAMRSEKNKFIYLHREIVGATTGVQVHHIDGKSLNNLFSNLKKVTNAENHQGFQRKRKGTSSKYRGVTWCKRRGCWQAQVNKSHKTFFLGHFSSEIEAAKARDIGARKHFGEHAALNFPV